MKMNNLFRITPNKALIAILLPLTMMAQNVNAQTATPAPVKKTYMFKKHIFDGAISVSAQTPATTPPAGTSGTGSTTGNTSTPAATDKTIKLGPDGVYYVEGVSMSTCSDYLPYHKGTDAIGSGAYRLTDLNGVDYSSYCLMRTNQAVAPGAWTLITVRLQDGGAKPQKTSFTGPYAPMGSSGISAALPSEAFRKIYSKSTDLMVIADGLESAKVVFKLSDLANASCSPFTADTPLSSGILFHDSKGDCLANETDSNFTAVGLSESRKTFISTRSAMPATGWIMDGDKGSVMVYLK